MNICVECNSIEQPFVNVKDENGDEVLECSQCGAPDSLRCFDEDAGRDR